MGAWYGAKTDDRTQERDLAPQGAQHDDDEANSMLSRPERWPHAL
jgi:hypothetical protein